MRENIDASSAVPSTAYTPGEALDPTERAVVVGAMPHNKGKQRLISPTLACAEGRFGISKIVRILPIGEARLIAAAKKAKALRGMLLNSPPSSRTGRVIAARRKK